MSDLSIHPVYLSARAAIVAPERAIPVTLYATQKWLPRLGPERWCLVMLLRGLSIDAPRRSNNTKRVTCTWRDLAEMLDVHEETIASWLKHKPIPHDKPWRTLIPVDEKAKNLALFIPRLRYAYETYNGKTRRIGFLLEILMEDPIVPEDEVRLKQQVELLRMQQGELGLETYRLAESVSSYNTDLPPLLEDSPKPEFTDSHYVNQMNPYLPGLTNPVEADLHKPFVNPDNTDLLTSVKQHKLGLEAYVNPPNSLLDSDKSVESGKNVNELDILIQQLKRNNLGGNLRRSAFEPIIQLTEVLLKDNHSGAMLYKVLNALYPERLDLYVAAIRVALNAAEADPNVNRGAVFVRTLRDFAEVAGVELGLKRGVDREGDRLEREEPVGTWVPTEPPSPLAPPSVDEAIWAETQSALGRQMTRATYEAVILGTMLIGRENGNYIIGVPTEMAKEWLEHRLRDIVQRTLSSVIGAAVNVEFRLMNVAK